MVLDKIIGFISPKWQYQRSVWRNASEIQKKYLDAAQEDRLNRNWRVETGSAETLYKNDRELVRNRARDMEDNTDFMNAILNPILKNVVGEGFTLQARTDNETTNNIIESLWKEWCKAKNCDITNTQSLNEILRMIERRKKIDGGIFIKLVDADEYSLVPLKLQCIEVDELNTMVEKPNFKGNVVIDGVEVNELRQPVGYHFNLYQPNGELSATTQFVPANKIIFYFDKKRPTQIREISDMAHSMLRIKDINEYMQAIAVKERVSACLSVFVKKPNVPSLSPTKQKTVDYSEIRLEPGLIKYLNPGEDLQVVNPSNQNNDVNQHIKTQQKLLASGQGLSYEATSRDMSESNYSSARQGLIEDEMTYNADREKLKNILSIIYEEFVNQLYLAKLINIDINNKDSFDHEWIRKPKAWIDPFKEANANKIALFTGQKTFKQICSENGRDWRDVLDDIEEVKKEAEKRGLTMEFLGVEAMKGGVKIE